jgi:hypothetical protein
MTRNLAARIDRLEAAKRVAVKVLGVSVDGTPMWREVMRDGVLHCLPRYEHDEWAERCRHQQAELQEQLCGFAALLGDDEPQAEAPGIVGNDRLAPLPAGKKRPRYIEAHGREIDAFTLTRN